MAFRPDARGHHRHFGHGEEPVERNQGEDHFLLARVISEEGRTDKHEHGDGHNERDWLHVTDHCRALDVLIDEVDEEGATGRSAADAPEIDGLVYLNGETGLKPGDMVKVRIDEADEYDLWASLIG